MTGPAPPQRKEMREKGASANQSSSISHFSHPGVRREAYFALVGSSSKKLGSLYYPPPLPLLPYTHTHTHSRELYSPFFLISLSSLFSFWPHTSTRLITTILRGEKVSLFFFYFSLFLLLPLCMAVSAIQSLSSDTPPSFPFGSLSCYRRIGFFDTSRCSSQI